jgi:hypothetical protein
MNYEDGYALAIVGVFLVLFALSFTPPYQRILVLGIAWWAGIGVPDALDPMHYIPFGLRSRWGNLGGFLGLTVTYAPLRLVGIHLDQDLVWICLASSVLGQGLGLAISSLVLQLAPRTAAPRIARSTVVTVSDYIPFGLRAITWAVWGIGCATVTFALAQTSHEGAAIVILVIAGLGLILSEVAGRAIVRRGQPAGSTDDVVWDDALRSSTLRGLLQVSTFPVLFTVIGLSDISGDAGAVLDFAVGLEVLALLVWSVGMRATRQWYLQQLWPGARRRTREEIAERDAAGRHGADRVNFP